MTRWSGTFDNTANFIYSIRRWRFSWNWSATWSLFRCRTSFFSSNEQLKKKNNNKKVEIHFLIITDFIEKSLPRKCCGTAIFYNFTARTSSSSSSTRTTITSIIGRFSWSTMTYHSIAHYYLLKQIFSLQAMGPFRDG